MIFLILNAKTLKSYRSGKSVEHKPPRDWDPLVKQTYSVWVETEKGRRKWHLSKHSRNILLFLILLYSAAYFTQATVDQLDTVDDIPRVRDVLVPDKPFKSTRMGKGRLRTDEKKNSGISRAATSRPYAPFRSSRPNQSDRRSPTLAPVFMHEPYRARGSTEPQSPTHDVPSCPAFPHDREGLSNLSSHPNQPVQDYHVVPSSHQNSFATYDQSKVNHAPIGRRETLDYYPSRASSSSWSNDSGIYGSSSPQRTPEIGVSPPALSSPLPSAYNLLNSTDDNSLRYIYPPPPPPVQNSQSHLSASYSSGSSFIPMSSTPSVLPDPGFRRGNIPVYSIFDDNRRVAPFPRDLAVPSLECALAPLSKIQRPSRYRREPVDEKTLRLLRMLHSSP
jgi:hypothetical protein